MKKETTKKSKLWIIILAALLLIGGVVGGIFAFGGFGGGGDEDQPEPGPLVTGPRADLYWNLDREFYTKDSQTGLSTREADANGQFKIRFAYNGEIVELVIVDKKLVNIIDTQDIMGLTFDENGVVIGQINVRELATETGKKVYVKKATEDTVYANSSMAMNGMELTLKMGQYAEIYDLRPESETLGKKLAPTDLQVMDCITVYSNADGDVTHIFLHSNAERSKIYWRANLWVSSTVNKGGILPDENGYYTLPFYCEGELVNIKTNDVDIFEYYTEMGKHSGFTGFKFDENGYAVDVMNAAIGVAGQQTFYAMDIVEINGNTVKLKNNWSTSGVQNWEGEIPAETPIYNVSSWAYSEGVMGQKISVADLQVGDRITMFSDMEGNPIEIGLTLRRVDLKPMFSNSSKYDAATRSTTRVKGEDGYWEYTFIDEKGVHKYKTKDQKLANFIDSYPERVFGIVTKGDKLVKAYEYECIYGYTRFSTALYVDSINGTIISCTDQKKNNAYTAVLSEDYKVLDISGDSKQWGQKIELQVGDVMISFRNTNKEICMIYVTKRSMGGKLYVNTTPNTSRALVTKDKDGKALAETAYYWEYDMTDINGKQVKLTLAAGKKDKDGVYANKYLQSRIDGATKGIIALEVSGTKIKDAHTPGNMASGNAVSTVIITKAGTEEFEYKTAAKPNDEASIYPGWTGSEGLKKINLTADVKSHYGEKLTSAMKVNDVYYMVRNRANETVALFLTSRGLHADMFFVKDPYSVVNGQTMRPTDADGYYVFSVMYQGKPATVRTKDAALAASLETKRTGAALRLDKSERPFTFTGVTDYTGTSDAYSSLVSNWDVSKISGKNVTVKLNIPTTSTEIGETKEFNLGSAKVYNISPDAGEDFGKITKLQKNDRVRVYTNKNGQVSYVLVTVRNGVKTEMCEHCNKKVTWNPLTATSGMGTGSAHYYVHSDIDVVSQWSVSANNTNKYDVVIDLNGKTVFNVGNNARTIMVAYPGKTLTLMDSSAEKTGKIQSYGYEGNAGLIQVSYGATLNVLGGTYELLDTLEGMKVTKQGGVIFAFNDSNYPDERCTVNIKGGTFIGGDVQHPDRTNGNDPLMTKAWSYGGTIYAQKSDVTISGGTITGGLADRGGNVYLGSTATLTVTGGEITGGQARNRGGNIFGATGSIITIDGGKVTGGTVLDNVIDYIDGNEQPAQKHTGQQGGNIAGYKVNLFSGEISGGTAYTTGGNLFMMGNVTEKQTVGGEEVNVIVDSNAFVMTGGKLANGTAPKGGANYYVYGNEGVAVISGGEVDASGFTVANDGTLGAALKVTGGKVGAASIGAKCGVIVGGDAQIESLSLNASALTMGIEELSATAKIKVKVTGNFAKAAPGFETLDIAPYANTKIVHTDAENGTISCVDVEGTKWLTAVVNTPVEPEPEPEPEPEVPEFATIIAAADKLVTDGVFTGGEVSAVCPVCGGEAVTWKPLTAEATTLADGGHYYLAETVTNAGRLATVSSSNSVSCIHLNGKTYEMAASTATNGAVGSIRVNAGTTVNIMDKADNTGTVIGAGLKYVDGSTTLYGGGAIDARGTVNIYGGTFMSNHAERPAVANFGSAGDGSVVNMYGGKIVRNETVVTTTASATSSLVRMHHAKQTFNMYGGEISGGMATNGGNVRMQGGNFNLIGGEIKNGQSANLGGNVCVRGGTFTMTGGTVSGGTTAASGGNFGLVSGTLDVQGGAISNGTGVTGGHIYVYGGTLNVSGGEWSNGTGAGGGIMLAASNNTFTGGTFTNNKAGTTLRDITVGGGKAATLGGDVDALFYVSGTLTAQNGAKATVTLTGSGALTLADDLAEGTEILVAYDGTTENAPLTTANDKASEYANTFVKAADESLMLLVNDAKQMYLTTKAAVSATLNETLASATTEVEALCPACGLKATWKPLTAEAITLADGDHYYLAETITNAGRLATVSSSNSVSCIHLNGKTYEMAVSTSENGAVGAIRVNAGSTVNIMDQADNSGVVIGSGLSYVDGTTTLYGGGAIDARGIVNIYGGTFMSNRADRPAVANFGSAGNGSVVNMYGGKIVRNEAVVTTTESATSSLVRMHHAKQTFNMYGGEISGGMATNGGNVRMQGGNFNLIGGTISGGEATNLGGNVCVRGGIFTMTGGEVKNADIAGNNNNNASGGNFGLVSGTLDIQGGVITNGTANNGGHIYVYGGTLNVSGGEFANGTGKGGAIQIAGGTSTITGGTFTNNKVDENTARDITVGSGKALTIGKTLTAKIYASGTVTAQNGTVATVELSSAGRIAFASDVAEGTKVTVIAAATQTIATIENAADFLTYFESGVTGATIGVKAETTNEIEITIPAEEPAPEA